MMDIELYAKELMKKIDKFTDDLKNLVANNLFDQMEPIMIQRRLTVEELVALKVRNKEELANYVRMLQQRNAHLVADMNAERNSIRSTLSNFDNLKEYLK